MGKSRRENKKGETGAVQYCAWIHGLPFFNATVISSNVLATGTAVYLQEKALGTIFASMKSFNRCRWVGT